MAYIQTKQNMHTEAHLNALSVICTRVKMV